MRTHLVDARLQVQIRFGFPTQRRRKIAGKNLPLRSIVQLDDMTFGMCAYLHSTPKSPHPKSCREWAPAIRRSPAPSIVVVMDDGLAAIAEFVFLLDYRLAIGGLA